MNAASAAAISRILEEQAAENRRRAGGTGHGIIGTSAGKVVFVSSMTGANLMISIDGIETIGELKKALEEKTGLPVDMMRLIYTGQQLEDRKTLEHYGVRDLSQLHMVYRNGGPPPPAGGGRAPTPGYRRSKTRRTKKRRSSRKSARS